MNEEIIMNSANTGLLQIFSFKVGSVYNIYQNSYIKYQSTEKKFTQFYNKICNILEKIIIE